MIPNEEIAEYALSVADKIGLEYAETYLTTTKSSVYAIEQGMFNGSSYSESFGLRIRVLKKKRMYTFSTNIFEKEHIEKALRKFKVFKGVDTELSKEPKSNASYKVREKTKLESGDTLKEISDTDKALKQIKYVKYRNVYGIMIREEAHFSNSEGSNITSNIPYSMAVVSVIVAHGTETRQSILQFGAVGGYEKFKALNIADQSTEKAKSMQNVLEKGITISEEELKKIKNVVIAPEITGIAVHESVGHPNEADRVFGRESAQAGTSYLTINNLGLEIGSERVNIFDDPTIENSYGFYLYDDEGVKARKRHIVKNGMQNELLTNREYAKILGLKSNASARSDSYSNEPLVRMSNSYLERGKAKFEELLAEAKNGVYIKSFTEWNIDDTRSFSRYQGNEAYSIKNGSLEKPIKNYRLEKSTMEFWHAVKLLGNDFKLYIGSCGKGEPMQGVPVTMGGPSTLLSFE
jgi:TldD protein